MRNQHPVYESTLKKFRAEAREHEAKRGPINYFEISAIAGDPGGVGRDVEVDALGTVTGYGTDLPGQENNLCTEHEREAIELTAGQIAEALRLDAGLRDGTLTQCAMTVRKW